MRSDLPGFGSNQPSSNLRERSGNSGTSSRAKAPAAHTTRSKLSRIDLLRPAGVAEREPLGFWRSHRGHTGTGQRSRQSSPCGAAGSRAPPCCWGDMDGLSVVEQSGLPFASQNGSMHACGHDMHTAGFVAAARRLAAHRDELAGSAIFMFQPGGESCGEANILLDKGLLGAAGEKPIGENPTDAYAIHIAPGPRGVFMTRPGAMAAGSNQLNITVHGRGGHGSQPHQTLEPLPVASEIVLALQSFVTRRRRGEGRLRSQSTTVKPPPRYSADSETNSARSASSRCPLR